MIGVVESKDSIMTMDFKKSGHKIYVIGEMKECIASSEYLTKYHEVNNSPAPYFDLATEVKVQNAIKDLIDEQVIMSAHDVSEGGLFVTLLESAMAGKKGFEIETESDVRKDAYLFGEAQSRVVVSVNPDKEDAFLDVITKHDVDFSSIGIVTSSMIYIDKERWGSTGTWKDLYEDALARALKV